ncbi:hypothetical protein HMI54_014310 [Coelomomyces lativittatus]|nr:hypothetical protein HMI56_000676 [Coelomomyces lativittatus]KAJ1514277.1 hypothetical protein HMI54_014310 [Coelomomyces lativittatus]KAJ1517148.1 hypothetical protein HMI55_000519 [Coelomomyces lativittatus]
MPPKSRVNEDVEASTPLLQGTTTTSSSSGSERTRSHERSTHITLPVSNLTRESSTTSLVPPTDPYVPPRSRWSGFWQHLTSSPLGKWIIWLSSFLFLGVVTALGYAVWTHGSPHPPHPTPPHSPPLPLPLETCFEPECVLLSSKLMESLNTTQKPCEDFYQFSCGNWEEIHEIPEDRARIGIFNDLAEQNTRFVRRILEGHVFSSLDETPLDDTDAILLTRLRAAYGACMAQQAIDAMGPHPLIKLASTFNITFQTPELNPAVLAEALIDLQLLNINVLMDLSVDTHPDTPDRQVISLSQPNLILPSKSYYNDSEYLLSFQSMVENVLTTFFPLGPNQDMLGFFGRPPALTWAMVAKSIVDLETQLAAISWEKEDLQDPIKTHHPMNLTELENLSSFLPWTSFFQRLSQRLRVPKPCDSCFSSFIVMTPSYFEALGNVLNATSTSTLNYYFTWNVLYALINQVDTSSQALVQPFKTKVFGLSKQPPRYEHCIQWLDTSMGMATGRYFVLKQFGGPSKSRALRMVKNILDQFDSNLDTIEWMDSTTHVNAKKKVKGITLKLGYPEFILNTTYLMTLYRPLTFRTTTIHFDHVVLGLRNRVRLHWQKLGQPTDKEQWDMLPHTVNAYYNPLQNEIVFPAGILQPPFFHVQFPDAINFGAIGSVIGHEILHGFDNHGRHYDPVGRLLEWWTPTTAQKFQEKSQCFVDQYSQFYILDPHVNPVYVNGKLTLGENLADNGGMYQSVSAFSLSHDPSSLSHKLRLPGLPYSPQQLFFLAFSHVWCGKMRPQYALQAIRVDPHSPNFVRVNAAVQNSEAFANAFQCPPGSRMRSKVPCKLF